jgi:hypothetical protein
MKDIDDIYVHAVAMIDNPPMYLINALYDGILLAGDN